MHIAIKSILPLTLTYTCLQPPISIRGPHYFNSLTAIDTHERQHFNELHWWLVTQPIFVYCQRLMARKIAELFGLNRGIGPFYAACCLDELSRGSVLCLLNASFKKWFPQRHNSIFYAEINDHGVHRDNTGQILAWSRHPVASRVALDLPYWAMRLASSHLIHMAIEMASKVGASVRCCCFFVWLIIVK